MQQSVLLEKDVRYAIEEQLERHDVRETYLLENSQYRYMPLSDDEQEMIIDFLREEGAVSIDLFGSYATGKEDEDSDIDLLVEFEGTKTLLDLSRMQRLLSEMIGRSVDLVTKDELSPHIRDRVQDEKVVLA